MPNSLSSHVGQTADVPQSTLGRTGRIVSVLALGGEGVLRTHGRLREATALVDSSLRHRINIFDTAPAWASSEEYLGAALAGHRHSVFVGSKTHDRTRDGSWRLLEESLRRLRTDVLDLWQIQDLRTHEQLRRISAPDGAMSACREAREQGIVGAVGITGHYDHRIIGTALRRFDADVVTVSVNPADRDWQRLDTLVSSESSHHSTGVIAKQVTATGRFIRMGVLSLREAFGYALSQPNVGTAIIDCDTPEDVEIHARAVREFSPFSIPMMRSLEERSKPHNDLLTFYRRCNEDGNT